MFEAWVGTRYADETNVIGGARLLILGEAHYDSAAEIGSERPELTREVVEAYVAGRLRSNATFFRRVERLVTGRYERGLTAVESKQFWDSVVFYNYIPVIAGNKPGDRPPEHLWGGKTPQLFFDVVKRREAEIVLVCGRELWRKKPHQKAIKAAYKVGERPFEAHEINWSPEWGAVAAHILHPSGYRGWSYDENTPPVQFLFEELNRRRHAKGIATVPTGRLA
ncbi:hypothetical protein HFN65_31605 [Rhizobium laguerreae]|uniref:hypothetical protein n=1 Tax=Rhizobium laguerreae TaxID=1076926 RepID=UPI001C90E345|nr:hypothetical protein [Rhizobium laguerreae]MBY3575487.1 hypothetical protein [Rhizobium laguerreae]